MRKIVLKKYCAGLHASYKNSIRLSIMKNLPKLSIIKSNYEYLFLTNVFLQIFILFFGSKVHSLLLMLKHFKYKVLNTLKEDFNVRHLKKIVEVMAWVNVPAVIILDKRKFLLIWLFQCKIQYFKQRLWKTGCPTTGFFSQKVLLFFRLMTISLPTGSDLGTRRGKYVKNIQCNYR